MSVRNFSNFAQENVSIFMFCLLHASRHKTNLDMKLNLPYLKVQISTAVAVEAAAAE